MSIESVKFRGRHVSKTSVMALVTGILAIILLIVMIVANVGTEPSASVLEGMLALIAAVLSLFGFIACAYSFSKERDIYHTTPIAGMAVNGIAIVLYIILFLSGK